MQLFNFILSVVFTHFSSIGKQPELRYIFIIFIHNENEIIAKYQLQPVSEVLEHLPVSLISCKVVGSILTLPGGTLTQQLLATVGQGWGDTTPCAVNWVQKSPIWGA